MNQNIRDSLTLSLQADSWWAGLFHSLLLGTFALVGSGLSGKQGLLLHRSILKLQNLENKDSKALTSPFMKGKARHCI